MKPNCLKIPDPNSALEYKEYRYELLHPMQTTKQFAYGQ